MLSMGELPELLTVSEVAKIARVKDVTVYRWARDGRLPHVRMPSGIKRFRRQDVEAMLRGELAGA